MYERVEAASPWVAAWGYSRAVRRGAVIEVAGTTAAGSDGQVVGAGEPYLQARRALEVTVEAIERLGGSARDIVRTRVFVRHISDWPEIGRAHVEILGEIAPASSCIGGADFLDPEVLVEIETTAVLE